MTTNNEQHLAALDRQIKSAQVNLELGKTLERLRQNQDFKKLVLQGYLTDEAVRLVHLKADPNLQSSEKQAAVVRDIDAIGAFKMYLETIAFLGRDAERSIADAEAQKQEIEEEEAE